MPSHCEGEEGENCTDREQCVVHRKDESVMGDSSKFAKTIIMCVAWLRVPGWGGGVLPDIDFPVNHLEIG